MEAVTSTWHSEWRRVYSADWAASIPFRDGGVDYRVVYSPLIKLLCLLTEGARSALPKSSGARSRDGQK